MGGGLMQLVAYGAQDIYLTGNPQITFFKVVYRRHTNFSMESIEQTFNGNATWGKKVTCTISRNGDLIHRMYLQVALPDVSVYPGTAFRWLPYLGHILIKTVELEIGGQRIDKHYGEWLHIWNELTQSAGHQIGYANMVGNTPDLVTPMKVECCATAHAHVRGRTIYVPLEFWFNRNPGLALPLIALQYHEVKVNIEFRDASDCYWYADTPQAKNANGCLVPTTWAQATHWNTIFSSHHAGVGDFTASLWVDYIYLDTDERRRFAQVSHEYLIEQLQFTGDESTSTVNNKIKLNFNHPVKELIWVVQPETFTYKASIQGDSRYGLEWFNFSDDNEGIINGVTLESPGSQINEMPGVAAGGTFNTMVPVYFGSGTNPVASAKLQLNGHDRFAEREGMYFNLVQPYQHHENVPKIGINLYSFGLKPEEHQPSGTCNFSRIDSATVNLTLTKNTVQPTCACPVTGNVTLGSRTAKIKFFAINYNVLRIMSGMGGLAFSC
jgi:hypothetical protein